MDDGRSALVEVMHATRYVLDLYGNSIKEKILLIMRHTPRVVLSLQFVPEGTLVKTRQRFHWDRDQRSRRVTPHIHKRIRGNGQHFRGE
jgi:hypothetical protein